MARKLDKQKALIMRQKGMSYSQIKKAIGVSKSTLSGWLYDMPLSPDKIKELRDNSPIRIENYRNTMRAKREAKFLSAYKLISKKIGKLTEREFFLCGLFLYWAEGGKTKNGTTCLTNTNPNMLKFFILWLNIFNVSKEKFRIHLHLYSDMNIKKEEKYWSNELKISLKQFRKSYIKKSLSSEITYKNGFGHGTCTLSIHLTSLTAQVLMGIKYIQDTLIF